MLKIQSSLTEKENKNTSYLLEILKYSYSFLKQEAEEIKL